mmetsp:Transcript_117571/g.191389  ORF Transcript_117571/g.191389 Transcript_117571/m.191389 type:complete len:413 (-) Transcript_117571:90-1328(-)
MSGVLPGPPTERARSPVRKNGTLSRSNSLNRQSGRAIASRGEAAPGGAELAAGLANASAVSPASCSGRDRLWLPSKAAGFEGAPSQRARSCSPAASTLVPTSAPIARQAETAPVPAPTPARWEGDASVQTIRPPTEPLPQQTSAPSGSGRPASAGRRPSRDVSARPASAGRQPSKDSSIRCRPASAGGRLAAGKAAPKAADVPAAGMRAGTPPCPPGHQQRVQHYCQEQGVGWSPSVLKPEEQLRHDPILHKIEVYMRGESGDVKRFGTHKGHYTEVLKEAALRRHAGRRKGMSEFEDLCALGAPKWDPGHRAALEQDRHVFYRQHGQCAEFCELAAKYPCQPKPFEPNRFMKGGGSDAPSPQRPAVLPPRRIQASTSSARTRRPPSAGRRSAPAGAAAPPTLVAPAPSAKQ